MPEHVRWPDVKDRTRICSDPEHNFPSHMVIPSSGYTHQCPSCGEEITLPGPGVNWDA